MLGRIRIARVVRLALVAAVLLSIASSFGLHPEPLAANPASPVTDLSALRSPGVAHGCLACLTHGAAIVSPLAAVPTVARPLRPFPLVRESDWRSRLDACRLPGRSPPARS